MAKSIAKKVKDEAATGKVKMPKGDTLPPKLVSLEDRMLEKTTMIKRRREVIYAQQKELDEWRIEVADFMKIGGHTTFGGLLRTESVSEPKWEGLKNKELDNALEQLLYELPDKFLKQVIDTQKLCNALPYNKDLQRLLKAKGLELTEGKRVVTLKTIEKEKPV